MSWRMIGREAFFYLVVCPLFILYVVFQLIIGITLLIPVMIAVLTKSLKWKLLLRNPWRDIWVVGNRMWLHIRYTYYQVYFPWKESLRAKWATKEVSKRTWGELLEG